MYANRKHLNGTRARTIPMSDRIHTHRGDKLLKGKKDSIITPATIPL
jgi:hypothetical protein